MDIDVPSQELAEKCQLQESSRGVRITSCWSLKIVVGEVLSAKMCQRLTSMFVRLCWRRRRASDRLWCLLNVRAGIKVMVALPGARTLINLAKIKKEKSRFESLGMICSLGELGISDSVVLKEFADASNLARKLPGQVRKSFITWWWTLNFPS